MLVVATVACEARYALRRTATMARRLASPRARRSRVFATCASVRAGCLSTFRGAV